MTAQRSAEPITLSAAPQEDCCLAYANTLSWRGGAAPRETLAGPRDLLGWLAGSGGIDAEAVREVERWADLEPADAATLFAEAIALREAIYRVFSAIADGEPVADADLMRLNDALAAAPARDRLARHDDGYSWRIGPAPIDATTLLAPVLWSAGDLMTGGRRLRVRLCANDDCAWLFLDESKAGTRRWCSMTSCGNRAKARRHYQRSRRS